MRAVRPAARAAALAVALLLLPGCSWLHRQTDAELAAKERAEVRAELNASYLLMPYRGLKTVVRGSALDPPKPELVELVALSSEIMAQLSAIDGAGQPDFLGEAVRVGKLVAAIYRAGAILSKEDEDRYPLLWQAGKAGPLPAPWYDAPAEHVVVGTLDLLLYATGRQGPTLNWVYYEFDRAPVQPGWPLDMRLFTQQGRGLMYLVGGKHYAAEEELSAYLTALTGMSETERRQLGSTLKGPGNDGERVHKGLRAVGHLSRSLNRFALKRDPGGYDDLEAAVKQLRELGADNELTDWGELTLVLHRGDYARASQLLEHLSQSPFLTEEERAEVKGCAASIGKLGGGYVLFGRDRAMLVLGRALLARVGGIKTVLGTLAVVVGPERAAAVAKPLLLIWAAGSVLATDTEAKTHQAVDRGKELGKKGYDYLRGGAQKLKTLKD